MKKILFFATVLFSAAVFSQNKPIYQVFNTKGKKSDYSEILKAAEKADIILFGELHDDPVIHWLQLELTKDLFIKKKGGIILGAEMLEADNQSALNNYLAGKFPAKNLKDSVRLWPNFKTDYQPLVDFAKENKIPFIATNVPRKLASQVYRFGMESLDTISDEKKKFLPPLPIAYDSTLTCYREIFRNAGGHGGQNLPKSQAVKDATMAYFILQNYSPGKTFIHYNGTYHSDLWQGIAWYLKNSNPSLKILVISATRGDVARLEADEKNKGDFSIKVTETMTKTH